MGPSDLLRTVAQKLESLQIDYLITGSVASIMYGEPRFTNDIDIVIRIRQADVDAFCAAFPDSEFYVSEEAAREAVSRRSQFNVIHPTSGLKIDFMVATDDAFDQSRFDRARTLEIDEDVRVRFAAPEDVILRKLQYYAEGGSDKHLRDIAGILRLCETPVDLAYIDAWAVKLSVQAKWERVRPG